MYTSILIGMPRAQGLADAVRDGEEFRRLANVELALARQVAIDHFENAPRPRAHHHDAGREEPPLGNRVREKDPRLAGLLPQADELLVEVVAGDLIECAEGF